MNREERVLEPTETEVNIQEWWSELKAKMAVLLLQRAFLWISTIWSAFLEILGDSNLPQLRWYSFLMINSVLPTRIRCCSKRKLLFTKAISRLRASSTWPDRHSCGEKTLVSLTTFKKGQHNLTTGGIIERLEGIIRLVNILRDQLSLHDSLQAVVLDNPSS